MHRIGKDELETLKRQVDLVSLCRTHGVELKRTGKSYMGLCPFHADHNPSFSVDPKTNLWRCFGACATTKRRGGDAIAFLQLKEGLSFVDALERLMPSNGNGRKNGSKSSPPTEILLETSASSKEKPVREKDLEPRRPLDEALRSALLGDVVRHYEVRLASSTAAQRYLEKRGLFVPEILRAMRVGFADGSLFDAVGAKGETRERLIEVGVVTAKGLEALAGMIVVPLLDPTTKAVVSLYGRSIAGRRHHYLPGELRGLVNATAAMASEELVLVESVFDALSLLVLGVHNVVPLYGTNGWTEDHDQLVGGAGKGVALLLDSDEAGRTAARSLAAKLIKRGLRVRIAELPDHKDPNEALVAGMTSDAMRDVLEAAEVLASPASSPAVDVTPRVAARYDVEDLEGGFLLTAGPRRYRVRAISGGGFERLKVNVKLEDGYGTFLDTLDLYAARARRGFVVRASRSVAADEDQLERELGYLAEAAEAFVATKSRQEEAASRGPTAPELTLAEREQALTFLRDPKLLPRIVADTTSLGYVGEETNKTLGYLAIVSRKLEDPLSLLVLSQSGAGKSGLTELLERLTPPEDVVLFSRLTPAALYYMEKTFLKRKVVIIEERSGSEEADYSLRTLQSRKRLTLGVPIKDPRTGKTKTNIIEVEGPAVFLGTSTASDINHENSTRCFELYLDESVEQTERIHTFQRRAKTLEGQQDAAANETKVRLHWNAQRVLRPVRVDIPWASAITFPANWLRTRRDHLRFLNLIEASAFLHQYQRPSPPGVDPETAVVATVADYRVAYELAQEVLGSTLQDVKKPSRELLASMRSFVTALAKEREQPAERVTLSRREIRERTGLPDHQVRRLLGELVQLEHIELVSGKRGQSCTYRLPGGSSEHTVLAGLLRPEALTKVLERRS